MLPFFLHRCLCFYLSVNEIPLIKSTKPFDYDRGRGLPSPSHSRRSLRLLCSIPSPHAESFFAKRVEGAFVRKKVKRILAKVMVVALLQMGYNLEAATVHD